MVHHSFAISRHVALPSSIRDRFVSILASILRTMDKGLPTFVNFLLFLGRRREGSFECDPLVIQLGELHKDVVFSVGHTPVDTIYSRKSIVFIIEFIHLRQVDDPGGSLYHVSTD
jgi:hypothetical protein